MAKLTVNFKQSLVTGDHVRFITGISYSTKTLCLFKTFRFITEDFYVHHHTIFGRHIKCALLKEPSHSAICSRPICFLLVFFQKAHYDSKFINQWAYMYFTVKVIFEWNMWLRHPFKFHKKYLTIQIITNVLELSTSCFIKKLVFYT